MSSNTKLNREQKAERKEMLAEFKAAGGCMAVSECGRVTAALLPEFTGSRMALLAVATASPNELKVRRKVGEYLVLDAVVRGYGSYLKVPVGFDLDSFVLEVENSL